MTLPHEVDRGLRLLKCTAASNPLQQVPVDILVSKLFQYALKPNKIIPYFLKGSDTPISDDVTIATLITIERLQVLNILVDRYQGKSAWSSLLLGDVPWLTYPLRSHLGGRSH
jgi:hypothetical protein